MTVTLAQEMGISVSRYVVLITIAQRWADICLEKLWRTT